MLMSLTCTFTTLRLRFLVIYRGYQNGYKNENGGTLPHFITCVMQCLLVSTSKHTSLWKHLHIPVCYCDSINNLFLIRIVKSSHSRILGELIWSPHTYFSVVYTHRSTHFCIHFSASLTSSKKLWYCVVCFRCVSRHKVN